MMASRIVETGSSDYPNPSLEGNLSTYLRFEQRDFSQLPFNAVDSLILSSVIYLNFDRYPLGDASDTQPIPLIDILRFTPYDELVSHSWMKEGKDVEEFLETLARSVRFKDLEVRLFALETSSNLDKQFCAATFTGAGMPNYIAYRGTDGSVSGWKEDFDLSYKEVLPSHTAALSYLSGVLSFIPDDQPVIVGGHSKGGNLAEYAAACIDQNGFNRIQGIFNHDGPGFLNDPAPRFREERFVALRQKTITESSVFGMILEHQDDHRIVRSTAASVFQHRPLTWIVIGADFAYQTELNKSARLFDESLDAWLRSCSPMQREVFLTTIFKLVKSTEASTWEEFQANMMSNVPKLFLETRNLDDETRDIILQTLKHLRDQVGQSARGYLSGRLSSMMQKLPVKRVDNS